MIRFPGGPGVRDAGEIQERWGNKKHLKIFNGSLERRGKEDVYEVKTLKIKRRMYH